MQESALWHCLVRNVQIRETSRFSHVILFKIENAEEQMKTEKVAKTVGSWLVS